MKYQDALLFFTAVHKCSPPFGFEILMGEFYSGVRKVTFVHVCVHRETGIPHSTTQLFILKQDFFFYTSAYKSDAILI